MKTMRYRKQDVEIWYVPNTGGPLQNTVYDCIWHREDGPAYINDDTTEWWFNDRHHCYTGPAIIFHPNDLNDEWYIHGTKVKEEEYLSWLKEMDMDINNLSDEDKILIDLRWNKQ